MAAGAGVVSAWTEANVLATALGSLGIVLTLFYSAWSFRTTLRENYYAELDLPENQGKFKQRFRQFIVKNFEA